MAITLSEPSAEIAMKTSKVIYGLALLPFLAGVALAEPNQPAAAPFASQTSATVSTSSPTKHKPQVLADAQMDNVTAGAIGLDDVALIATAWAIGKVLDAAVSNGAFDAINFCKASGGKFGC
jgi:hypothetical protein